MNKKSFDNRTESIESAIDYLENQKRKDAKMGWQMLEIVLLLGLGASTDLTDDQSIKVKSLIAIVSEKID